MMSLTNICKKYSKNIIRNLGYNIVPVQSTPENWIKAMDIRTILDIGANVGQFAMNLHKLMPDSQIYSFEPIECCYNELLANMKHIKKFKAFNFGLGDSKGEVEFYKNSFTPGSSILKISDLCKKAYPYTSETEVQKILIHKLDDFAGQLEIVDNILIKIDVQGYEDKVIKGGFETVIRAKVLIVETSFQELYLGQPLFENIYELLKDNFYYMGSLERARLNKSDCSPLFADSIFINKNKGCLPKVIAGCVFGLHP